MPSELDIYRSASVLIESRGADDAKAHATSMIERALNDDVRAVWIRIRAAIDELLNEAPGAVH